MEIKKEVKYEVTIIAAFMLLALFLYFYTSPSLTGNVIVSTSTNITFDNPSDYTYNSSLIEITNGDVSLILQEATGTWVNYNYSVFGVEKAYYDYSNKTSYVTGLNDSKYKFEDNELFEITFSDFLENGDIIDLHVDDEDDESTIYLCKSTTICSTNNYGSVYHNGTEGVFTITVQNLPNSTKSFTLISDEDVDLDFINSSKGPVINAMTEPYDQTSLLTSKDGNDFDVESDEILNLRFPQQIQNNDTITLYLDDEQSSDIFICQSSDFCQDNYGSISFPNTEGWYNITVSNLQHPVDTISLLTDNQIDLDFVEVHRATPIYNSETNYTYENASIETQNFELNIEAVSGTFSSEETLNNQNISYYYLLDSGNYNLIDSNITLNSAATIKFKAELTTNSTDTPTLSSISFVYDYDLCEESWDCTAWSECSGLSLQTRICQDLNSCGTASNKPIETQNCVKTDYEVNQTETLSIYTNETIRVNTTNLELNILGNSQITGANITITRINNDTNIPGTRALTDFNIEVDNTLNNNINNTEFKVYYDEDEIENILESSLKLYYFNETSLIWEELDSIVDTEENYLAVNLTHFSTYGVFGQESSSENPSSDSAGSGGRSSFVRPSAPPKEQLETETVEVQTPQETQEEPEEQKETETLPQLTGRTIIEVENTEFRKQVNWVLLVIAIISILFLIQKYNKKPKKRLKLIHQTEDSFGID